MSSEVRAPVPALSLQMWKKKIWTPHSKITVSGKTARAWTRGYVTIYLSAKSLQLLSTLCNPWTGSPLHMAGCMWPWKCQKSGLPFMLPPHYTALPVLKLSARLLCPRNSKARRIPRTVAMPSSRRIFPSRDLKPTSWLLHWRWILDCWATCDFRLPSIL